MEFMIAIPIIILPLFFPCLTGFMAKSLGRKFWPWFLLGIPLPFIANIILLCLPVRNSVPAPPTETTPVGNDELYHHLFQEDPAKNN